MSWIASAARPVQKTSPTQGRGSGGHVPALLSKGEPEKGMRAECCCDKDAKHSNAGYPLPLLPGIICKVSNIRPQRSAAQRSATGSVSGQIRQSTVRLKVLAPIEPKRFVSDVAQAEPVAYLAEAPWVWLRKSAKWWLPRVSVG